MRVSRRAARRWFFLVALILPLASAPRVADTSLAQLDSKPPTPAPKPQATPRADSDLLVLSVSVADEQGRFITALEKDSFTVYADKQPQEIVSFTNADAPSSIGLIFDASTSMAGFYKPRSKEKSSLAEGLIYHLLEHSHPLNEYFLIGFNDSPQLLLDRTTDGVAVIDALNKLTTVRIRGKTALYDACYLGVDKATYGKHARRAVVLITDGRENASLYDYDELIELLLKTDVLFFSVTTMDGLDFNLQPSEQLRLGEIVRVAQASGGYAFDTPTPLDMADSMEIIGLELRTRYTIGIKPANLARKNDWHNLEIKVAPYRDKSGKTLKLHARTRRRFFAPATSR